MFLARVAHSSETVENILAAVAPEVNPGVLLNGDSRVYFPDTQHILPSDLFKFHPLLPQPRGGLPEQSEILAYESVGDVQICLIGEFQE